MDSEGGTLKIRTPECKLKYDQRQNMEGKTQRMGHLQEYIDSRLGMDCYETE